MTPFDHPIPDYTLHSLQAYVDYGIPTGSFLRSVLENNLAHAVGRADSNNLDALPAIVRWVYNKAPHSCWGSEEKVDAWLTRWAKQREAANAAAL